MSNLFEEALGWVMLNNVLAPLVGFRITHSRASSNCPYLFVFTLISEEYKIFDI